MKKIVGIIAAMAMAASVFALDIRGIDITGNVNTNISILKADLDKNQFDVFNFANGGEVNMMYGVGVGGDKVGGSFNIRQNGCDFGGTSIWVQPIDQLKFTFGGDFGMNECGVPQGGWHPGHAVLKSGTNFKIDIMPADGLTFTAGLATGPYMTFEKDKDPVIGAAAAKISYAGDGIGNISAMFTFSQTAGAAAAAATDAVYGWTDPDNDPSTEPVWGITTPAAAATPAGKTTNNIAFAIGYTNTFDPISLIVDAMLSLKGNGLNESKIDLGAKVNVDAFYFGVYGLATLSGFSTKLATAVLLESKISYALDNFTPYVTFVDENLLSDAFDAVIKGGATWNYGSGAIDCGVQYDVGKKVLEVPLSITVNF